MAYIPDEAIERSGDISPNAFRLYAHYCKRRNAKTGGWYCPSTQVFDELSGMSRGTYFRSKKELIYAGWIDVMKDFVIPKMGFTSLKNNTPSSNFETFSSENGTDSSIKNETNSSNFETNSIKNETFASLKNETKSLKSETKSLKNETPSIKNETVYKDNQTLPNITRHNHRESVRMRPDAFANPVNSSSHQILQDWLNGIAEFFNAPTIHSVAFSSRWETACIKAIDSGLTKDRFLAVLSSEFKDNAKYATPDRVLQAAQTTKALTIPKTKTKSAREQIREEQERLQKEVSGAV